MRKHKKTLVIVASVLIGCIVLYFGIGEYQKYEKRKVIQDRIAYLDNKIEAIESGDYSSVSATTNELDPFYLSDFSARVDGTLVKGLGSLKNLLSVPVDSVINIAFFDEYGELIRVKAMSVQLDAGETKYFEELIGSVDNTPIPVSAEITN